MLKSCCIVCKKSSKSGKTYLVLVVNDIFVTFDRMTIERVAMTVGITNIDLADLKEGEVINII